LNGSLLDNAQCLNLSFLKENSVLLLVTGGEESFQ
jgi:hypothetical protein